MIDRETTIDNLLLFKSIIFSLMPNLMSLMDIDSILDVLTTTTVPK